MIFQIIERMFHRDPLDDLASALWFSVEGGRLTEDDANGYFAYAEECAKAGIDRKNIDEWKKQAR